MFYFLLPTYMTYKLILLAAAVIPALFMMVKVYRSDRLERETPYMLWDLVKAGILSSLIALVSERILSWLLNAFVRDAGLYQVLLYFVVVACSEEIAKYFMLYRRTWFSQEFNCRYDGVVYAVFVSLGFALWENISYVMHYGLSTALLRAVTAIPGHTCFGVFMGVFYGTARQLENQGDAEKAKTCRLLSVVIPVLLHGTYDYIASTNASSLIFVAFVIALFAVSYSVVTKSARQDTYI